MYKTGIAACGPVAITGTALEKTGTALGFSGTTFVFTDAALGGRRRRAGAWARGIKLRGGATVHPVAPPRVYKLASAARGGLTRGGMA